MILNGLILLLLFFAALFFAAVAVVVYFYVKLRSFVRQQRRPHGSAGSSAGRRPTDGDPFSSGERRSSTDGCDVTVVDTRSESVAKRKIFDSSDGEYVDYVTVKE